MDWHRSHPFAGRCQFLPAGAVCDGTAHHVRSGDGIVFLDLRAEAYSCAYLPVDGPGDGSSVAGRGDPTAEPCIVEAKPLAAAVDPPVTLTAVDILFFLCALIRTGLRFPGRPLSRLVSDAAEGSSRSRRPDIPHALAHAAKFNRMMPFLPFRPACLFGSYLMLNYLHLRHAGADWIFGAQLFPFRAHCWLAAGPHPLNDRADNIAFYAPILRVSGARP